MEKERLMSILIEKNNDYFRGCHDVTDSSYIYDAQINTARKIVGKKRITRKKRKPLIFL